MGMKERTSGKGWPKSKSKALPSKEIFFFSFLSYFFSGRERE